MVTPASSPLASQTLGRVIRISFDVTLTPPGHPVPLADMGDTDRAMEIGHGLIREAAMLVKAAAEAEGFGIDITAKRIVF